MGERDERNRTRLLEMREDKGMANIEVNEEHLMTRLRWRIIPFVMFLYIVTIIDRDDAPAS